MSDWTGETCSNLMASWICKLWVFSTTNSVSHKLIWSIELIWWWSEKYHWRYGMRILRILFRKYHQWYDMTVLEFIIMLCLGVWLDHFIFGKGAAGSFGKFWFQWNELRENSTCLLIFWGHYLHQLHVWIFLYLSILISGNLSL